VAPRWAQSAWSSCPVGRDHRRRAAGLLITGELPMTADASPQCGLGLHGDARNHRPLFDLSPVRAAATATHTAFALRVQPARESSWRLDNRRFARDCPWLVGT
jgi:hypothetical protein